MESSKSVVLFSLQVDLSTIGVKYLHYRLLKEGYDSRLLHLPHFRSEDTAALSKIEDFVKKLGPLFMGFSLMSVEYPRARELSFYLKEKFPDIPVIWGGMHPTTAPESCLPPADYVCVGEGDRSIVDFADALYKGLGPRSVNNLCYLENGHLKQNPLYPLVTDLDGLSHPHHISRASYVQEEDGSIGKVDKGGLHRHGRYQGRFYDVLTSRGCPFSCTYCCNSYLSRLYGGGSVRQRSMESIIAELERAVKENDMIDLVNFQDENFLSYDRDFIKEFCAAYKEKVAKPFMFACIPSFVKRDKIGLLKDAGLSWVRMGLQSGSDRVCKDIYRRASYKKHFLEAMQIMREHRVGVYCDVILDNPLETEEDCLGTARALKEAARPFYLQQYSLIAYYRTEIQEMILKECPGEFRDKAQTDYFHLRKTTVNDLIRVSAYLPAGLTERLLQSYERDPQSMEFRALFSVCKPAGLLVFEPLSYLRVFKMTQGDSFIKAIKTFPPFIRMFLVRYIKRMRPVS